MNHQRQINRTPCLYMGNESIALPSHIRHATSIEAEIIKSGLTNADDARMLRTRNQIVKSRLLHPLIVRVNAYGGPKIGVFFSQTAHAVKLL